jgi:hypothetical protein
MAPSDPPKFTESEGFGGNNDHIKSLTHCDVKGMRIIELPTFFYEEAKIIDIFRQQVKLLKEVESLADGT